MELEVFHANLSKHYLRAADGFRLTPEMFGEQERSLIQILLGNMPGAPFLTKDVGDGFKEVDWDAYTETAFWQYCASIVLSLRPPA